MSARTGSHTGAYRVIPGTRSKTASLLTRRVRPRLCISDKLVELLRAQSVQFPSALIVAAAGNESKREIQSDCTIEVSPPAAADGIVAVAAVQTAGATHGALTVASFSN